MAASLQPTEMFADFIKNLGLRKETAQQLWQGGITTPQELAASPPEKLRQIVDDDLLANHIHPVLQKYIFPISVAEDPYARALALLRKDAEEKAPLLQNQQQTQSDATGYAQNSSVPGRSGNGGATSLQSAVFRSNSGVNMDVEPTIVHTGTTATANVSGGTFIQSTILPQKEVTYNNTNSRILVHTTEEKKENPLRHIDFSKLVFPQRGFLLEGTFQVRQGPIGRSLDPNAYSINTWGQSRALIINNIKIRTCAERFGANEDSKNLENLLRQLGFKVESHTDKTKENTFQILREFTASTANADAPMILVFIGSHGQRDARQDYFFGTDYEKISDEDVVNFFTETAAPLIKKEIPKLFFFQFCRLNKEDTQPRQNTQSDSLVEIEEPRSFEWLNETVQSDAHNEGFIPPQKYANMLFAYATTPGNKAFRNCLKGTWFVTAICKVLKDHACTEDLLSMLTMVNGEVMEERGREGYQRAVQMCEVKSYLSKKVKFFQ